LSDAVVIASIAAPTLLAALWMLGKAFAAHPVSRVEFEALSKEVSAAIDAFSEQRRESRDRIEQLEHEGVEIKLRHDVLLKHFEASKSEVEAKASELSRLVSDASRGRGMRA
jgi:hypothetical protein